MHADVHTCTSGTMIHADCLGGCQLRCDVCDPDSRSRKGLLTQDRPGNPRGFSALGGDKLRYVSVVMEHKVFFSFPALWEIWRTGGMSRLGEGGDTGLGLGGLLMHGRIMIALWC